MKASPTIVHSLPVLPELFYCDSYRMVSTSITSFVQFGIFLEEIIFLSPPGRNIGFLCFQGFNYEAWIVTDLAVSLLSPQSGSGSAKYRSTQGQWSFF